MKTCRTADEDVACTGAATTGQRARRRLPAWAATLVATAWLGTALATAFATAASAAPGPAARVTPGVERAGPDQYVFYTAADGSVWQKTAGGGAATAVGGRLVSGPSPIYNGSRILVFGQGTDNALWETSCAADGGCGPWHSLGGRLTSKPGASDIDGGNYSVYVRGTDTAVWARDHTATGWGPWHSAGGRVLAGTGPSAAYRGSQHVLVAGADKHLWLLRVGGPGFSPVGGQTTASPALANTFSRLVGFARGTDGAGWWANLSAVGGWRSMGPAFLTSGLGAAGGPRPTPDNNTYTVGLGGDGQVYQDHADWSGTTPAFGGWIKVTP